MADQPTWEVLIPTIPHRHEKLCHLLEVLDKQWQPGFSVRIMRDNLQRKALASYAKWQDLMELATSDYISFAGDDDSYARDAVPRIMQALRTRPDYVGFRVLFKNWDCQHSLQYDSWGEDLPLVYRDINHSNPIKRELALLSRWDITSADQDEWYAARLRETGLVRHEVWIDEKIYHYLHVDGDDMWTPREPFPLDQMPKLPEYPWLIVHDLVDS